MATPVLFLLMLTAAYLCGAIPTSVVVARWMRGIDIRDFGSGNAGGTNSFRVLGTPAGIFVSTVDVAKGAVAAGVVPALIPLPPEIDPASAQVWAGLAAVLGHVYPVFAGFQGGKGVATGGGMFVVVAPATLGIAAGVFITTLLASRYVSLSSILAALVVPLALFTGRLAFGWDVPSQLLWISPWLPLFIAYTHRSNIERLLAGTERRVGRSKIPPAG